MTEATRYTEGNPKVARLYMYCYAMITRLLIEHNQEMSPDPPLLRAGFLKYDDIETNGALDAHYTSQRGTLTIA